jgi:hypothetical protein
VAPGAPEHFVDGGALAVQMGRGDISFMGLGTVTHVEGTKLCGFGHPMMEAGNTALPTAIGRVLWIFASDQHSSKIGEAVRPLGALIQDRQSAVVADESRVAPTFRIAVDVKGAEGAPKTHWDVEIAEERFMGPSLAASALSGVVEATTNEKRDITWNLHSRLRIRGHAPVELDDYGIASGGMPDDWGHARIVKAIGDVLNNPWAVQSMEKHTSYCAMMHLGMPIPETWMIPPKAYEPLPDLAPTLKQYAKLFDLGAIGSRVGYPMFMKPYDGGNVGVIFQPTLPGNDLFYQFGDLPLPLFG